MTSAYFQSLEVREISGRDTGPDKAGPRGYTLG